MLTWLGHSTAAVDVDGVRLLTDPVLGAWTGPLRRIAPPVDPATHRDVAAVLLSHLHADHTDVPSLRLVGTDVPVLAPPGAGAWLRRHGMRNVRELARGETVALDGVRVTAVQASHARRRWPLIGPSAPPSGYVIQGSWSTYFAGDTDLFDGMADLPPVDVALVPVTGWGPTVPTGHLDPARAAEAISRIPVHVAVPVHWGTLAPPLTRPTAQKLLAAPLRFAELAGERSTDVDVLVLLPGESASGPFIG